MTEFKLKRGGTIPFGYEQDPFDPKLLRPVPKQLEAYEKALDYLHVVKGKPTRSSWGEVARWLSEVSGRYISEIGLRSKVLREKYVEGSKYSPTKAEKKRTKRYQRKKADARKASGYGRLPYCCENCGFRGQTTGRITRTEGPAEGEATWSGDGSQGSNQQPQDGGGEI